MYLNFNFNFIKYACLLFFLFPLNGCFWEQKTDAQEEQSVNKKPKIPAVDVVKPTQGFVSQAREYIGTTQPLKEIILRSQAEGQILTLNGDIGDRIEKGQVIATLDNTILKATIEQLTSELLSLNSAVTEAQADVISAQAQVKSAQVRLSQAQLDANRLQELYNEGAIAKREVELAKTELATIAQEVKSAQSQVKVRQAAVETAKGRIISQKALIDAEKKKLVYTEIRSPRSGYVLEKLTEVGNLTQIGGEIIKIGDFSQIKVTVDVSELELKNLSLGKAVKVKLDAFPQENLTGIINRISPSASQETRQIPVEILLGNQQQKINGGLLARIKFSENKTPPILIPESALDIADNSSNNSQKTIFIVSKKNNEYSAIETQINIGKKESGQVEVLSGVTNQDSIIIRSSEPLTDGKTIKLSAISQTQ